MGSRWPDRMSVGTSLVTGQLENHSRLGKVKREVARVLTELRAREIAAAESMDVAETGEAG